MNRRRRRRFDGIFAAITILVISIGASFALNYSIYASHHGRAEAFRERIIDAGYKITHESDGYDGRINFRIKANGCAFYLHHPYRDTFDIYQWVDGELIGKGKRTTIADAAGAIKTTRPVPYSQFTLETLRESTFYKKCANRLR